MIKRIVQAATVQLFGAFLLLGAALAQTAFVGLPPPTVVPVNYCQFSPTSPVVITTQCASSTGAKYAYICASGASYWRDDGTIPAGTAGIPLGATAGQPFCMWYAGNLSAFQIISAASVISIAFYK